MNLILALVNAGIDADRITRNPLGDIRIGTGGGYIAVGSESMDDGQDTEWWAGTRYDADGGEAMIFEGTDMAALVRTLAAA